jgi:hypothetical protein
MRALEDGACEAISRVTRFIVSPAVGLGTKTSTFSGAQEPTSPLVKTDPVLLSKNDPSVVRASAVAT